MTDLTGTVDGVAERFVPEMMRGEAIEAEHMIRYWWVSQLARARRVLDAGCGVAYGSQVLYDVGAAEVVGVDLSPEIVEAARGRVSPGIVLEHGDLRRLRFPDDRFDLVVCFEVIEHVADPSAIVRELARVLAPGGVLAISTPNPRESIGINPHHVRELTGEELLTVLARSFPFARLVRQQNWMTSAIVEDEVFGAAGGALIDLEMRKIWGCEAGQEVYTLALASDRPPPALRASGVLTSAFQVRELIQRIQAQEETISRLSGMVGAAAAPAPPPAPLPPAPPARVAALEDELARTQAVLHSVLTSRSWRLFAPARAAAARVRGLLRGR